MDAMFDSNLNATVILDMSISGLISVSYTLLLQSDPLRLVLEETRLYDGACYEVTGIAD